MTAFQAFWRRAGLWIEAALVLAILASVARLAWVFFTKGYLPQPFIYDTHDTFMDWFNTAYWAQNRGAFDVWGTVYPPFSFVFLRVFGLHACYRDDPFYGRDCDWLGRGAIVAFYLAAAVLMFRCYWSIDRRTALLRGAAMALGLPMLFALERGNLIVPCLCFFVLGYGRIVKQAWLKWLSVAVTINFKPYLLLAALPQAARRRWRWLEGCALATVFIYAVSYGLEGAGSPIKLFKNTLYWMTFVGANVWGDIFYSTSYKALVQFMTSGFPIFHYVGSQVVETATLILPLVIRAGQLSVVVALAAAWLRPGVVSTHRLSALGMALVLSSMNPGGYAEVFLLFLVFTERMRGPASAIAVLCAYLLCISADVVFMPFRQGLSESWLSGQEVFSEFGVAVFQFVRPGLVLLIEVALSAATVHEVWKASRASQPALARFG